ncbi:MAG TPA: hypothetical protein VJG66_02095 [Patescibacteria group bacterium]|nr:hypothetical protein [Patescibacteria group bacterium]
MIRTPFYDPTLSYEDNYDKGPFSSFASGDKYIQQGEPQHDFLGHKVYLPFGIPAGPLLNSKFVKGAFEQGFDIAVYKTVRSEFFPCHPFPNVLSLDIKGDLTPEKLEQPLIANTDYKDPISITNSFGVPSKKPEIWQEDAKKAVKYAGKGQVMILSFMGTVKPNQTQDEFVADYVLAAKLAYETGAKVLEANLSCPNIGNEGLVCYNLEVTEKVAKGIREVIGNTPLVLKVGFYKSDKDMEKLAEIVNEYADDVAGINTLQAEVRDIHGNQALPGPNRLRSGICGHCIKWAGIDFVKRMADIRLKNGYKFSITGVGGVTSPEDYKEFRDAGADVVMSATGAMWNPKIAQEIKSTL